MCVTRHHSIFEHLVNRLSIPEFSPLFFLVSTPQIPFCKSRVMRHIFFLLLRAQEFRPPPSMSLDLSTSSLLPPPVPLKRAPRLRLYSSFSPPRSIFFVWKECWSFPRFRIRFSFGSAFSASEFDFYLKHTRLIFWKKLLVFVLPAFDFFLLQACSLYWPPPFPSSFASLLYVFLDKSFCPLSAPGDRVFFLYSS